MVTVGVVRGGGFRHFAAFVSRGPPVSFFCVSGVVGLRALLFPLCISVSGSGWEARSALTLIAP